MSQIAQIEANANNAFLNPNSVQSPQTFTTSISGFNNLINAEQLNIAQLFGNVCAAGGVFTAQAKGQRIILIVV